MNDSVEALKDAKFLYRVRNPDSDDWNVKYYSSFQLFIALPVNGHRPPMMSKDGIDWEEIKIK